MTALPSRSFLLLACLLLMPLTACGERSRANDTTAGGRRLPAPGPSYLVGSRTKPTGGRMAVGLLITQNDGQSLASLISPEKLRAYTPGAGLADLEEPSFVDYPSVQPRLWGREAKALASIRRYYRTEYGVDIDFQEVLATDCDDLPLVLLGRGAIQPEESKTLERYRDGGGRIVRINGRGSRADRDKRLARVKAAIRETLAASGKITLLQQDPLAIVASREGEHVVVEAPRDGTRVHLEAPDGTVLAHHITRADGRIAFEAPDPTLDPFQHRIVATWSAGGQALRRAWTLEELVGTTERELSAAKIVQAGGVMACRIKTTNTRSGNPVGAQRGTLAIVRDETALAKAAYVTDARGLAHPHLSLDASVTPGAATLVVDEARIPIVITSGLRVSVVTDRPLYKPTDRVHVRAMLHRVGDGRPVADTELTLAIGNAKRVLKTSKHGIASHTFDLREHRVGPAAVKAVCEDAQAFCRFRVKSFERPTFTLEADPPHLELRPGEQAPVTLRARYVNGTPMVAAHLTVRPLGSLRIPTTPQKTKADGNAEFAVKVRASARGGGRILARVHDRDGRYAELFIPVRVKTTGPILGAELLSGLAVGIPARFRLTASEPTTLTLDGDFSGLTDAPVDIDGDTIVTLVPTAKSATLRMRAPGGAQFSTTFRGQSTDGIALVLDRHGARIDEQVNITIGGPAGRAHLDVWRDGALLRTESVELDGSPHAITLPLSAELAGVLRIRAHYADPAVLGRESTLLVTRGRALEVEAKTAQATYGPGAEAALDVTVRDHQGNPTSAVLGYWGVDTALLALAPMTSGHEEVFDVMPAKAKPLAYGLAAQADGRQPVAAAALAKHVRGDTVLDRHASAYPIRTLRTPALRDAAKAQAHELNTTRVEGLWEAYADAWNDIQLIELWTSDSMRETFAWLAARGDLDAGALIDPWGVPYKIWSDEAHIELIVASAGPDGRFNTPDDLTQKFDGIDLYLRIPERVRDFHAYVRRHFDPKRQLPRRTLDAWDEMLEEVEEETEELFVEEPLIMDEEISEFALTDNDLPFEESFGETEGIAALGAAFDGPAENSIIGIGGGAGGAFRGRSGGRSLSTGGGGSKYRELEQATYVRKDFDPTLCFVPEAIVGPDGKAQLKIPLKDSITTWHMRLVASNDVGAVGVGTGSITVRQPVHATPWLAPHLTVGDVVDVPVAVRNEQDHAATIHVRASVSDHLEPVGTQVADVDVGPGETGRATLRYRAVAPGKARVRIVAATEGVADAQERIVEVHPYARTIVDVLNGSVSSDVAFPTVMAAAGPGDVRMDLYPSPLSEALSGFEGLIRAPHG